MSKEAWKRLIVAIGGLVSAVVFALTNKDLDPGVMEKVINAIVWIVTTYVAQSGLHSSAKALRGTGDAAPLVLHNAPMTTKEAAAELRDDPVPVRDLVGPR